jgi:hypothetical protein
MRVPLVAALAVSLIAAGCSPAAAPEQNGQGNLVEAEPETAPANDAAALAPAAAGSGSGSAVTASAKGVRRCGWLSNPTPANWWLTDSQGQWILGTQGADQAPGMDEMPDMSTAGWVETNGSYGYGCACMTITADADGRVTRIEDAEPKPLKQCRADRKLPKPE